MNSTSRKMLFEYKVQTSLIFQSKPTVTSDFIWTFRIILSTVNSSIILLKRGFVEYAVIFCFKKFVGTYEGCCCKIHHWHVRLQLAAASSYSCLGQVLLMVQQPKLRNPSQYQSSLVSPQPHLKNIDTLLHGHSDNSYQAISHIN